VGGGPPEGSISVEQATASITELVADSSEERLEAMIDVGGKPKSTLHEV
jgi:hypothetical protein